MESGFAEYMGGWAWEGQEYEKKQQKWRIGKTLLRVAQGISDNRGTERGVGCKPAVPESAGSS